MHGAEHLTAHAHNFTRKPHITATTLFSEIAKTIVAYLPCNGCSLSPLCFIILIMLVPICAFLQVSFFWQKYYHVFLGNH